MLNSLSLLGDAGNTALPLGPCIPVKPNMEKISRVISIKHTHFLDQYQDLSVVEQNHSI